RPIGVSAMVRRWRAYMERLPRGRLRTGRRIFQAHHLVPPRRIAQPLLRTLDGRSHSVAHRGCLLIGDTRLPNANGTPCRTVEEIFLMLEAPPKNGASWMPTYRRHPATKCQ